MTFLLSNRSSSSSLEFTILLHFPIEFPANALDIFRVVLPESGNIVSGGTIEPGQSLLIAVELLNSKFGSFSDTVKLVITDANSMMGLFHTIQLEIVEEALDFKPSISIPSPFDMGHTSPIIAESPVSMRDTQSSRSTNASEPSACTFLLKGCKRLSESGLHELDLGKVDLNTSTPTRKIVLEVQSGKCFYAIRTITPV